LVRRAKRILILCPASAKLVWKHEIGLWAPGYTFVIVNTAADLKKPAHFFIVSHGLMSQANGAIPAALCLGAPFDMTAIDEAQAFNAPANNRVNALRRAAPRLGDITPLSGTPMKNHAGELYTLLSICWPDGIKMPRHEYEEKFCKVTHRRFGSGPMVKIIEGSKNLDVLKKLIAPFMLRVRKDEVLKDLPPILWDAVPVVLDFAAMPSEDLARLDKAVNRQSATGTPEEDLTHALRRITDDASLMSLRRMLGLAKLRGATEYIIDMLDSLPDDRKVLVFAHHLEVIAALATHFGEYSPAVLTGKSTPREREEAVDKFLTDPRCRVFVGNIQAAGTAITLVGPKCKCSDVVFVESSWTPMDNAQAACRVHRIGQHDGVVARMLSAAGTIDDLVNGLLVRKARDFTQLFDTQQTGAK
jgi:SWI/SNF-related matrix-associated actin-dependent regulator 1 of chromatin subfamily A